MEIRGSAFQENSVENEITLEDAERKWKQHSDRIKERTYDINLATATMAPYDPLADEHLQDYFNAPNTRKHLIKLGLIDQDGNIIDEKRFKKNQIQLDKKAHEEHLLQEQMEREMDHDIEVCVLNKVALRLQAKKTIERRSKLRTPGEGIPETLQKYPISMQTTALIYTNSINPSKLPEKRRSKSATVKQTPKAVRPATAKPRPQTSGSVLKLFEAAKMDYKHGEWKRAEEGLMDLLERVTKQTGTTEKKSRRTVRPKSARPTRHSAFPVSSAFSECDSEGDVDVVSDMELDKIFGEDVAREVVPKSTVVGIERRKGSTRPQSRSNSRPTSPTKKTVTIPNPKAAPNENQLKTVPEKSAVSHKSPRKEASKEKVVKKEKKVVNKQITQSKESVSKSEEAVAVSHQEESQRSYPPTETIVDETAHPTSGSEPTPEQPVELAPTSNEVVEEVTQENHASSYEQERYEEQEQVVVESKEESSYPKDTENNENQAADSYVEDFTEDRGPVEEYKEDYEQELPKEEYEQEPFDEVPVDVQEQEKTHDPVYEEEFEAETSNNNQASQVNLKKSTQSLNKSAPNLASFNSRSQQQIGSSAGLSKSNTNVNNKSNAQLGSSHSISEVHQSTTPNKSAAQSLNDLYKKSKNNLTEEQRPSNSSNRIASTTKLNENAQSQNNLKAQSVSKSLNNLSSKAGSNKNLGETKEERPLKSKSSNQLDSAQSEKSVDGAKPQNSRLGSRADIKTKSNTQSLSNLSTRPSRTEIPKSNDRLDAKSVSRPASVAKSLNNLTTKGSKEQLAMNDEPKQDQESEEPNKPKSALQSMSNLKASSESHLPEETGTKPEEETNPVSADETTAPIRPNSAKHSRTDLVSKSDDVLANQTSQESNSNSKSRSVNNLKMQSTSQLAGSQLVKNDGNGSKLSQSKNDIKKKSNNQLASQKNLSSNNRLSQSQEKLQKSVGTTKSATNLKSNSELYSTTYTFDSKGVSKSVQNIYGVGLRKSTQDLKKRSSLTDARETPLPPSRPLSQGDMLDRSDSEDKSDTKDHSETNDESLPTSQPEESNHHDSEVQGETEQRDSFADATHAPLPASKPNSLSNLLDGNNSTSNQVHDTAQESPNAEELVEAKETPLPPSTQDLLDDGGVNETQEDSHSQEMANSSEPESDENQVSESSAEPPAALETAPSVRSLKKEESIGGSMEIIRSTIGQGEDEIPPEADNALKPPESPQVLRKVPSVKFSEQLISTSKSNSRTSLLDNAERKSSLKKSKQSLGGSRSLQDLLKSQPTLAPTSKSTSNLNNDTEDISIPVPTAKMNEADTSKGSPIFKNKVVLSELDRAPSKRASLKMKQMKPVTESEVEYEYSSSDKVPNRFQSITSRDIEEQMKAVDQTLESNPTVQV